MGAIETTILSIILMIALGYFIKRIDLISLNDVDSLNNLVIYVLLPCMIFSALYSADLSLIPVLGFLPFIILFSSFITGIVSYFILKKLNFSDRKLWSVLITLMIANTGFMGYPVNIGIFGYDGFLRAIFCDIATMFTFLILSFVLVLKFGGTVKTAIRKILFFPPLWAIVLGVCLNLANIQIGDVLNNTINYLGNGAIPVIMISLGISIDLIGIKRNRSMVAFTLVMKLLFFPLVAFFIVSFFGLVDLQYSVSIVEAAMPSGMLSLILAITYKLDFELTSDCIFINTIFSLLTLPIIIMLL